MRVKIYIGKKEAATLASLDFTFNSPQRQEREVTRETLPVSRKKKRGEKNQQWVGKERSKGKPLLET